MEFSIISFQNFGCSSFQMKLLNKFLEVSKLLTTITLPKGIKYLDFHNAIILEISLIFFSRFKSGMSLNLSMSYVIRRLSNFCVHSKFNSWHKVALLSPRVPILITFVFSVLIFNPEMD